MALLPFAKKPAPQPPVEEPVEIACRAYRIKANDVILSALMFNALLDTLDTIAAETDKDQRRFMAEQTRKALLGITGA